MARRLAIVLPVRFHEAIRAAERRRVELPDAYYGELQASARSEAFTISGLAGVNQISAALETLTEGLRQGMTFAEWKAKALAEGWMLSPAHLELVLRAHTQTAYMRGQYEKALATKDRRPFLMYSAINDHRTRPSHLAMDGIIRHIDDAFWDTHFPPCGFNCFLPGTQVRGDFELGFRMRYSGPAVELVTRSGKRLSVTANHPVLTGHGWRSACQVERGAYLIGHSGMQNALLHGIVYNEDAPALAEDKFEAFASQALRVVPVSPLDFDGDAEQGEGEVYVAGSNRELMGGLQSDGVHGFEKRGFIPADAGLRPGSRYSSSLSLSEVASVHAVFAEDAVNISPRRGQFAGEFSSAVRGTGVRLRDDRFDNVVASAGGFPGSAALALDGKMVGLQGSPFHDLRFALSPQIDLGQAQRAPDGIAAGSALFGQLLEANAAAIALDEVIEVRKFAWTGHVYDFQTENGIILANGLVVHNCRCGVITLTEEQARDRGGPTQAIPIEARADPGWGIRPTRTTAGVDARVERAALDLPEPLQEEVKRWHEAIKEERIVDRVKAFVRGYAGMARDVRRFVREMQGLVAEHEAVALRAYTGDHYGPMNRFLRGLTKELNLDLLATVSSAVSALAKLTPFEGMVYRGAFMSRIGRQAAFRKAHVAGEVVQYEAFTSASWGTDSAFHGDVLYRIRSRTGRVVEEISEHGHEREVLFPPGAQFRVISSETRNGNLLLELEELATRVTVPDSHKFEDAFDKARRSEAPAEDKVVSDALQERMNSEAEGVDPEVIEQFKREHEGMTPLQFALSRFPSAAIEVEQAFAHLVPPKKA